MPDYVVKILRLICVFVFLLMLTAGLFAQESKADTLKNVPAQVTGSKSNGDEEMVLDVIEIKGHIEKPGVTIIPKRIEPEMEERDINRSFDDEVKKGVGEISTPDDALRKVDRVKSIKKAIEKKRK